MGRGRRYRSIDKVVDIIITVTCAITLVLGACSLCGWVPGRLEIALGCLPLTVSIVWFAIDSLYFNRKYTKRLHTETWWDGWPEKFEWTEEKWIAGCPPKRCKKTEF